MSMMTVELAECGVVLKSLHWYSLGIFRTKATQQLVGSSPHKSKSMLYNFHRAV